MGDDDADRSYMYGVVPTAFFFLHSFHFAGSRRLYTNRREIAANLVLEYCWIDNEVVYPKCVHRRCRRYVLPYLIGVSKFDVSLSQQSYKAIHRIAVAKVQTGKTTASNIPTEGRQRYNF